MKLTKSVLLVLIIASALDAMAQNGEHLVREAKLACAIKLDSAIAMYDQAIKQEPENIDFYIECVNCLLKHERNDDALLYMDKLVLHNPQNATFYFARANILELIHRPEEEICADYLKAITLHPNYVDAYYNLAAYYLNRSVEMENTDATKVEITALLEKSRLYMTKAFELVPSDKSVVDALSKIQLKLDEIGSRK